MAACWLTRPNREDPQAATACVPFLGQDRRNRPQGGGLPPRARGLLGGRVRLVGASGDAGLAGQLRAGVPDPGAPGLRGIELGAGEELEDTRMPDTGVVEERPAGHEDLPVREQGRGLAFTAVVMLPVAVQVTSQRGGRAATLVPPARDSLALPASIGRATSLSCTQQGPTLACSHHRP